ncbi:MAG: molybdate ABC transporter substrate-binding protein [Terriglobales bacterium]
MRRNFAFRLLAVVLATAGLAGAQSMTNKFWPPWTPPPGDGLNFTIQQIDNVPDLHGDIVDPQLVVFFAGNQFMATAELMQSFRQEHPEVQRIFWETLPPGILAKQMEQGALIVGNLRIAIKPDIYTAGTRRIKPMQEEGKFEQVRTYARNRLAIMVAKGNPKRVLRLKDLARPEVRVSMPNPEWEGVASLITESYKKAGGEALVTEIMQNKVKSGATFLTQIHHRQTPLRIMLGESDAGVVLYSEARFQEMIGNPISMVEIPAEQNMTGVYLAGVLKDAPHPEAARAFAAFLIGRKAQEIFKKYGFLPPPEVQR